MVSNWLGASGSWQSCAKALAEKFVCSNDFSRYYKGRSTECFIGVNLPLHRFKLILRDRLRCRLVMRRLARRSKRRRVGYVVDHNRVQLGIGQAAFEQAKKALQRWQMFNLGWVQMCWPAAPLACGATVGVLSTVCGLWVIKRLSHCLCCGRGRLLWLCLWHAARSSRAR